MQSVVLKQAAPVAVGMTVILFLLTLVAAHLGPLQLGDIPVYAQDAAKLYAGQLPYTGLHLEYLPGVLPFVLLMIPLGLLTGSLAAAYCIQTLVVFAVFLIHIGRVYGRRMMLTVCLLLIPLLQFVFYNLDIFSAITLYAAIYALRRKHYGASALWLAASTLIKTYPIVCLLGLLWAVPRGQRRRYVLVFGAALAAVLVPLAVLAPHGFGYALGYHTGRPLEFESSAAAIGYIMHLVGQPLHILGSHGSIALIFPGEPLLNAATTLCLLAGFGALGWAAFRGRLRTQPATLSMLLLLLFILFFKVGSPQYLVPVLLLFPLVYREQGSEVAKRVAARLIILGSIVWLQFILLFNTFFVTQDLLSKYIPLVSVLAVLRIVALVELMVYLIRRLRPAAAPPGPHATSPRVRRSGV